jgi:hypothetical protein
LADTTRFDVNEVNDESVTESDSVKDVDATSLNATVESSILHVKVPDTLVLTTPVIVKESAGSTALENDDVMLTSGADGEIACT